jgi:hypothetical protein
MKYLSPQTRSRDLRERESKDSTPFITHEWGCCSESSKWFHGVGDGRNVEISTCVSSPRSGVSPQMSNERGVCAGSVSPSDLVDQLYLCTTCVSSPRSGVSPQMSNERGVCAQSVSPSDLVDQLSSISICAPPAFHPPDLVSIPQILNKQGTVTSLVFHPSDLAN